MAITQIFTNRKPIRVNTSLMTSARILVHIISMTWLLYILFLGFTGGLEGDPVQYLLDFTGIGAINLLFLSLIISPTAMYFKFGQLIVLRRTLGVYSAVYALSHFMIFIAFELQFEWLLIASEIVERPYITVGFASLVILTLLLATSLSRIQKRMGKSWFTLHNWVYIALILALTHYLWSIKSDELQPLIYSAVGVILLLLRRKKIRNIFK